MEEEMLYRVVVSIETRRTDNAYAQWVQTTGTMLNCRTSNRMAQKAYDKIKRTMTTFGRHYEEPK